MEDDDEDAKKREKLVRMLMEKSPSGTDVGYIVKSASVLYKYIYNNTIEEKKPQRKDNLIF